MEGFVEVAKEAGAVMGYILAEPCIRVINEVLPIALPVMGAIVVIGIGVKVFKRFMK